MNYIDRSATKIGTSLKSMIFDIQWHPATSRAVLSVLLLFCINPSNGDNSPIISDREKYTMETHIYKQVGAVEIKADVYRPAGDAVRPVIFWIHGGALVGGSRTNLPPEKQFIQYMEAGYVLVSIDYRLAPVTKLAEIVKDVEDAYAWLRKEGPTQFKIDPERIAVMGMSAGGYLTLTSGFRLDPRPKALISIYGYGDITGDWYSKPYPFYIETQPIVTKEAALKANTGVVIANTDSLGKEQLKYQGDFYMYCRQNGLWPNKVSGRDPLKEPEWFTGYEARKNVTQSYPPTLLLHGEKDTDVIFEQSVLMAEALKRHGVEHELISQPHWGHGFDYKEEDPSVQDAHNQILQFLSKHLM